MLELIYEHAALILTVAAACWYVWSYRPLKRTVEGLAKLLDAVMKSDVNVKIKRLAEKERIFLTDIPNFATLTHYGKGLADEIAAETIAKEYYEQVLRQENAHGYKQEASYRFATEQLLRFVIKEQMELTAMQEIFKFPAEQLPQFVTKEQMKFIDAMQEASFKFATEQLPELVTKTQMKLIDKAASNADVERYEILKIIGIVMRDILLGGGLKKVKGTSS